MNDRLTCGRGLAENASLPAKVAELSAAIAELLELHADALDLTDEAARKEHEAYLRVVRDHRASAAALKTMAEDMRSYEDLPVAKHDPTTMSSRPALETFERVAKIELELLTLLQKRIEHNQKMLVEMVIAQS